MGLDCPNQIEKSQQIAFSERFESSSEAVSSQEKSPPMLALQEPHPLRCGLLPWIGQRVVPVLLVSTAFSAWVAVRMGAQRAISDRTKRSNAAGLGWDRTAELGQCVAHNRVIKRLVEGVRKPDDPLGRHTFRRK